MKTYVLSSATFLVAFLSSVVAVADNGAVLEKALKSTISIFPAGIDEQAGGGSGVVVPS